ncbi:MAG: hypothetical protein M1816_007798 [Peltula sp. TS41687]|nr:MAG: hypothetical protein M1816_007798 [Peltula sp. TS41687]
MKGWVPVTEAREAVRQSKDDWSWGPNFDPLRCAWNQLRPGGSQGEDGRRHPFPARLGARRFTRYGRPYQGYSKAQVKLSSWDPARERMNRSRHAPLSNFYSSSPSGCAETPQTPSSSRVSKRAITVSPIGLTGSLGPSTTPRNPLPLRKSTANQPARDPTRPWLGRHLLIGTHTRGEDSTRANCVVGSLETRGCPNVRNITRDLDGRDIGDWAGRRPPTSTI